LVAEAALDPADMDIRQRLRVLAGPVLKLVIFLTVVFLFLGLQMSAPYTRADPECSVWCVLEHKIKTFVGIKAQPLPK
jgi:hypothetical protein